MPVRNTENKRKLRGIDIAFLMEAVEERARFVGLEGKTFTFSRNITLEQVNEIIGRYNEIAQHDASSGNNGKLMDCDKLRQYENGETGVWIMTECRLNPEELDEITDASLLQQTISNLYENVSKMCAIQRAQFRNLYQNTISNSTCEITPVRTQGKFYDALRNNIINAIQNGTSGLVYCEMGVSQRDYYDPQSQTNDYTAEVYGILSSLTPKGMTFEKRELDGGLFDGKATVRFEYSKSFPNTQETTETIIGMIDTDFISNKYQFNATKLLYFINSIFENGKRPKCYNQDLDYGYSSSAYLILEYTNPIFNIVDRTVWDI